MTGENKAPSRRLGAADGNGPATASVSAPDYSMSRPVCQSPLLVSALDYAARGWHVLPCHRGGKTPLTQNGVKDATTSPEIISRWWDRWPDANVAIACGPSDLLVVDVDNRHAGMDTWRDVCAAIGISPYDDTVTVETPGGGLHVYYRADGHNVRPGVAVLGPGVDVRAGASYVIAPPSIHPNGGVYAWAYGASPDEVAVKTLPPALAERLAGSERRQPPEDGAADGEAPILEGQRNATLASLAGSMRRRGMSRQAIEAALREENSARCVPPLGEDEVRRIAASIARYKPAGEMAEQEPADDLHCTDLGNARRLVCRYGQDLRYCDALGGWLVWDGRRWRTDEDGTVQRLAKEAVLGIYDEAAREADDDRRRALAKWAMASESAARQRAMLDLAWSEAAVCVTADMFDADPWLLNVANGTIDLRTGALREHRREDYITKLAPIEYDPTAEDDVFARYLQNATGGDVDFARYLQKAAGFTLTGVTDEEDVFLLLGPAGSGKTTFIEAMLCLLGDYAVKAAFDTFLEQRNVGVPRPDLVRLRGARLVAAVEPERGRRLAAAAVKEATGGDTMTARDLYKPPVSFRPRFKLWLAANDPPEIADDDSGLWRRIKRLPFERSVPEERQDPAIKRHLCTSEGARAVLAWAVKGCLLWQQEGLKPPAVVRRKTAELRADMNPLTEFLESCCILERLAETPAGELRDAYEKWANEMGAKTINNREWGKRLRAMGCESVIKRGDGRQRTVWRGIGLLATDPQGGVKDVKDKGHFSESPTNSAIREDFSENAVCASHPSQLGQNGAVERGGSVAVQPLAFPFGPPLSADEARALDAVRALGKAGAPAVSLRLNWPLGRAELALASLADRGLVAARAGGWYEVRDETSQAGRVWRALLDEYERVDRPV